MSLIQHQGIKLLRMLNLSLLFFSFWIVIHRLIFTNYLSEETTKSLFFGSFLIANKRKGKKRKRERTRKLASSTYQLSRRWVFSIIFPISWHNLLYSGIFIRVRYLHHNDGFFNTTMSINLKAFLLSSSFSDEHIQNIASLTTFNVFILAMIICFAFIFFYCWLLFLIRRSLKITHET